MASRSVPSGEDAVRITTAAPSRDAEISARQRRYAISMLIRTICFISAVAVGPGWLRWVLIAGAVLLPYVAVVLANATDNRSETFALRDSPARNELPPTASASPEGRDR